MSGEKFCFVIQCLDLYYYFKRKTCFPWYSTFNYVIHIIGSQVSKEQWGAIYLFQEDRDGVYHHSRGAWQSLHHVGEGARCMIHLQEGHMGWTVITLFSNFKSKKIECLWIDGWNHWQVIDSLQLALIGSHNCSDCACTHSQKFLILTISKLCSICNSVICKRKTRRE